MLPAKRIDEYRLLIAGLTSRDRVLLLLPERLCRLLLMLCFSFVRDEGCLSAGCLYYYNESIRDKSLKHKAYVRVGG